MRVTQKMMVDSMNYWLSKQADRLYQAQMISSTGYVVNDPSDSPVSNSQILSDRASISRAGQYQSNITQAMTWIEAGTDVLDTVYALLTEAQSVISDQSSGDLDTRDEMAATLASMYEQVVDLANTDLSSSYLFSGDQTDVQPFRDTAVVSPGAAEDIVFDLAADAAGVEITITDASGNVVRTISLSSGVEGANTVSWDGLDDSGVALADGEYSFTVSATDASGSSVASWATYRGDNGAKEVLIGPGSVVELDRDGSAIFSDALKALSEAIAALESDSYDTASLDEPLEDMDTALAAVQKVMSDLSTTYERLESRNETLAQSIVSYQNRMSEIASADLDQAAVELQAQETAYEAALAATSLILNIQGLINRI